MSTERRASRRRTITANPGRSTARQPSIQTWSNGNAFDDGSDPAKSQLKPAKKYRLTPSHAGIYQDGAIHSIDYPDKAVFIRVTGTNLDRIPRNTFDLETGKVTQMTPQAAS